MKKTLASHVNEALNLANESYDVTNINDIATAKKEHDEQFIFNIRASFYDKLHKTGKNVKTDKLTTKLNIYDRSLKEIANVYDKEKSMRFILKLNDDTSEITMFTMNIDDMKKHIDVTSRIKSVDAAVTKIVQLLNDN